MYGQNVGGVCSAIVLQQMGNQHSKVKSLQGAIKKAMEPFPNKHFIAYLTVGQKPAKRALEKEGFREIDTYKSSYDDRKMTIMAKGVPFVETT